MIEVIGLNTIGSIAAIEALKSGDKVYGYEEHKESGKPSNCSGLYSKNGLNKIIKRYINWKPLIMNRIDGAILDFAGEQIELRKKEVAYVLDRAEMDKRLAEKAEEDGVIVKYNTKKEEFKGDIIIGADGITSSVAKRFKFPKLDKIIRTAKTYIKEDKLKIEENKVYMFSREQYKGLFAWLINRGNGYIEAGIGTYGNPYRAFSYFMKELKLDEKPSKIYGIPISVRRKTSMEKKGKKVLLVGNAAGQVKPSTGGGIIIGSHCAKIAGESLDPIKYEFKWRSKFLYDLLLHGTYRKIIDSLDNKGLNALGKQIKKYSIDNIMSKYGDMEHLSKSIRKETIGNMAKFAIKIISLMF